MKGKVVDREGRLWIEYLTEGAEADSVEKNEIMIMYTEQHKTTVDEIVEFEISSYYTISDNPLAIIK